MGFILALLYLFIFLMIIRSHSFFKIEGVRNEALRMAFLLKIIAGFVLYYIYSYYYTDRATADIFKYFDDSKVMADALFKKPLDFFKMFFSIQNDTPYFTENYYNHMNNWFRVYDSNVFSDSHLIIRFNAFVMLFSFGYYHVHTVFICFLSFIGLVGLYHFFIEYLPKAKFGLFIAVFLIPSVVFWGSGVLKEGLIFFALGLLLFLSVNFIEHFSLWRLTWIAISVIILLYTKIYVFLIVFLLLIIFKMLKYNSQKKLGYMFVGIVFIAAMLSLMTLKLMAGVDIFALLAQKQHDFILLAQSQNAGSLINDSFLEPNWFSFLCQVPDAILNTFFRPLIGLDNSPMMIPSIIENVVIWCLIVISFIFRNKINRQQWLFFHFLFWIVIGVYMLTGITTPILGAIVRYKTIAMPFLGALFCVTISKRKVYRASVKLKKIGLKIERRIIYRSVVH